MDMNQNNEHKTLDSSSTSDIHLFDIAGQDENIEVTTVKSISENVGVAYNNTNKSNDRCFQRNKVINKTDMTESTNNVKINTNINNVQAVVAESAGDVKGVTKESSKEIIIKKLYQLKKEESDIENLKEKTKDLFHKTEEPEETEERGETEENLVTDAEIKENIIKNAKKKQVTKKNFQSKEKTEESEKENLTSKPIKGVDDNKIEKSANVATSETAKEDLVKERRRKRKSVINNVDLEEPAEHAKLQQTTSSGGTKRRRLDKSDKYCWRCHKVTVDAQCVKCPRAYHRRCMGGAPPLNCSDWVCTECTSVQQCNDPKNRAPAMMHVTIEQLIMMLQYVIERMREQTGSEPFWKAVDLEEVPNYLEYVIKPMDLSLLEKNLCAKMYNSTEAFMADAKWIQHNCIVFNTLTSKLTNTAKQMLKVARQEISEMEACPDCFLHGRNLPQPLITWFIEPCRKPHPLVWAKLKGFPFWPAKALPRLNTQGLIDVRFFGEHDRAWVSPKDVYLYSHESPASLPKKKKGEMELVVKEVEEHIKKLEAVFGEFRHATHKVPYDPHDQMQIKKLLPYYDPVQNKCVGTPKRNLNSELKCVGNNLGNIKIDKNMSPKVVTTKVDEMIGSYNEKLQQQIIKTGVKKQVINTIKNSLSKTDIAETQKFVDFEKSRVTDKADVLPTINGVDKVPSGRRSRIIRKKKIFDPLADESPPKSRNTSTTTALSTLPNATSVSCKTNCLTKNKYPVNKLSTTSNISKSATVKNDVKLSTPICTNDSKVSPPLDTSIFSPKVSSSSEAPKRTIAAVRRVIGGSIKKIKLTHEIDPIKIKKIVNSKNSNIKIGGNTIQTISSNNLQQHIDSVKAVTLTSTNGGTTKTIYVKKNLMGSNSPKVLVKATSQSTNKTLGGKEAAKVVLSNAQRVSVLEKDPLSLNNKPMTSIPISCEDGGGKTVYLALKSNTNINEVSTKNFTNTSIVTTSSNIKQEPRDDVQHKEASPQKSGKARKSFPNKTSHSSVSQGSVTSVVFSATPLSSTRASNTSNDFFKSSNIYRLPPPEAGPTTLRILQHSKELATHFTQIIIDSVKKSSERDDGIVDQTEATIHLLKLKMEKMEWDHQQEINELKQKHEVAMRELTNSMEVERFRALKDAQREAEITRLRCIEETKRKQWCVVCGREAMFYCCWNTAYCDYPCQQKHWNTHSDTCGQKTQSQSVPQQRPPSISPPMPRLIISKPTSHQSFSSKKN